MGHSNGTPTSSNAAHHVGGSGSHHVVLRKIGPPHPQRLGTIENREGTSDALSLIPSVDEKVPSLLEHALGSFGKSGPGGIIVEERIKCGVCQSSEGNTVRSNFCGNCGNPLSRRVVGPTPKDDVKELICSRCGKRAGAVGMHFCRYCGSKLSGNEAFAPSSGAASEPPEPFKPFGNSSVDLC